MAIRVSRVRGPFAAGRLFSGLGNCGGHTGDHIGDIESSKAESSLHAPLSGILADFNRVLLKDPSAINVDKYDTGWLFEMQADSSALLSPTAYLEHLEAVWQVTQKTIKGQLNH